MTAVMAAAEAGKRLIAVVNGLMRALMDVRSEVSPEVRDRLDAAVDDALAQVNAAFDALDRAYGDPS